MRLFGRIITMVFMSFVLLTGLTWDSKLDPNKIVTWDVLQKTKSVVDGIPIYIFIHNNPDTDSNIGNVKGFYLKDVLIAYVYYESSVPKEFRFNGDVGKYVEHKITIDEKISCIDCHNANKKKNTNMI